MGLSSWLHKANAEWLDLDALLSVALPPVDTISESTQMLAATYLRANYEGMTKDYVSNNSTVIYLTPILEMTLNDYFKDKSNFEEYLSIKEGKEVNDINLNRIAGDVFAEEGHSKVSSTINSQNDLEALLEYAINDIVIPKSSASKSLSKSISDKKSRLTMLETKINAVKNNMNHKTGWEYNQLVNQHNKLVEESRVIGMEYNRDVDIYNKLAKSEVLRVIMEIGGGINLKSRNFKVKTMSSSPTLNKFKNIARRTTPEWKQLNGDGTWIRSKSAKGKPEFINTLPKREWESVSVVEVNGSMLTFAQADSNNRSWLNESQNGSWRELTKVDKSKYIEKSYNKPQNKLQIAEFESGKLNSYVTGHIDGNGRIVFQKTPRGDLMSPQEPPIWWPDN